LERKEDEQPYEEKKYIKYNAQHDDWYWDTKENHEYY